MGSFPKARPFERPPAKLKITVAANIFAGRLERFRRFGLLDWKRMNRLANEILERIGATEIKVEMPINALNSEDRKIVELAHDTGVKIADPVVAVNQNIT